MKKKRNNPTSCSKEKSDTDLNDPYSRNSHNDKKKAPSQPEDFDSVTGAVVGKITPYTDELQTTEQKSRDESITELFKQYIAAYGSKVQARENYQKELFRTCISIVRVFSWFFVAVSVLPFIFGLTKNISGIVSVVTESISFLVLIVELLKIITRYCFPSDDEKYITEIVKAIQHNDLEDKRLNMAYKISAKKNSTDKVYRNSAKAQEETSKDK